MERYFILDRFNTWYDWRFILTAKNVTPPDPKTNYVNLDGMSGTLDLSEALAGEVAYKDRTLTASFWTDAGTFAERAKLIKTIIAALHGKKIKIVEPDDPEHYYYGRVKIKSTNNIVPYAELSITATCDPWRYSLQETKRRIDVNGSKVSAVIHNNGVKTLCPTITVTGSVTITHNDVTASLTAGYYKITDLKLRQGLNIITVSGEGSVTLTYREADL